MLFYKNKLRGIGDEVFFCLTLGNLGNWSKLIVQNLYAKRNVFFFVQCLFKFVQLTTSNLVEIQDIAESEKMYLK